MSKKQKRNISQGTRKQTAPAAPKVASSPAQERPSRPSYTPPTRTGGSYRTAGSMSGMGGRRFIPAPEFNPDYSYIKKDLKRIGVLAGSFFCILIALSFILK